ncbi:DUF5110 domain-containing protein [Caulobacter segnis]
MKVWPGRDATFTLYDDDGVTNAYEKGVGKVVTLRWDDKAGKLTATGDKALSAQAWRPCRCRLPSHTLVDLNAPGLRGAFQR